MKPWLLALCMSVSLVALADDAMLMPVYAPKPRFPETLKNAGVAGETRVQFLVHSNGHVSNIRILKSDDLLFSEASKAAVNQWQFKPWEVTAERPASIEVIAPMIFTYGDNTQLPMVINGMMSKLSCSQVNTQVATGNSRRPKILPQDLGVFSDVGRYLSDGIPSSQLSESRRSTLMNEFTQQIPEIIKRCAAAPEAYFADQLPDGVRAVL